MILDYTTLDDGTINFVSHHPCDAVYGLPDDTPEKDIRNITNIITSNAGEFLSNTIRNDPSQYQSEILEIDQVKVSCGIKELVSHRRTLFNSYYDAVSYNFILSLRYHTKIEKNLIKLKRSDFFSKVVKHDALLLNEIGMESPIVFIEEFIFNHPRTKTLFSL